MKDTTEYVCWGWTPAWPTVDHPVRLAGGSLRTCNAEASYRKRLGSYLVGIYKKGDEPVGLSLMVAEVRKA